MFHLNHIIPQVSFFYCEVTKIEHRYFWISSRLVLVHYFINLNILCSLRSVVHKWHAGYMNPTFD